MARRTNTTNTNKTTKTTPSKAANEAKKEQVETTETTPSVEDLMKLIQNLQTELAKAKDSSEKVIEEKPKKNNRRKALPTIDLQEQIPCISRTEGALIYISPKTGAKTTWSDYGVVQYLSFDEINTMRANHPKFIYDVWLVIDDDEVIDYLDLEKTYEAVFEIENLERFLLDNTIDELKDIIPTLPSGIKSSIATRAKKMVDEGSLDSRAKILLLERELNISLITFE